MKKYKKLTSKSGLTIPKDMRGESGFFPGMAVDMETINGAVVVEETPKLAFEIIGDDRGQQTWQP